MGLVVVLRDFLGPACKEVIIMFLRGLFVILLLLLGCQSEYGKYEPGESNDLPEKDRYIPSGEDDGVVSSYEYPPDDDDPAVFVESRSAVIDISAPGYGYDLSTELSLVTLEGVAREDVETVTWEVDTGASGTADGVQTWSAMDIPLVPGDNVITVTGTTTEGEEGSDVIVVACNPGVPLASDLRLSEGVVFVGIPDEVAAGVYVSGPVDSVVVGPSDESGALLEEGGVLERNDDGTYWRGKFVVDESTIASLKIRAFATVGGKTGATPPVGLEIMELPSEAFWKAMEHLGLEAGEVYMAANPAADPMGARDAVVEALLAHPLVDHVGTTVDDGYGVWWTAEGIGFILPHIPPNEGFEPEYKPGRGFESENEPEDEKSSFDSLPRPRHDLPRTNYPNTGTGSPRAWTTTSHGISGLAPRSTSRDGVSVPESNDVQAFQPFANLTSAEVAKDLFDKSSCPLFNSSPLLIDSNVTLQAIEANMGSGVFLYSGHGGTFGGIKVRCSRGTCIVSGFPPQVAVATGEPFSGQCAVLLSDGKCMTNNGQHAKAMQKVMHISTDNILPSAHWGFLPGWIDAKTVEGSFPGTMVSMSTCHSSANNSMAKAFFRAGASYYFGFVSLTSNYYLNALTESFWKAMLGVSTEDGVRTYAKSAFNLTYAHYEQLNAELSVLCTTSPQAQYGNGKKLCDDPDRIRPWTWQGDEFPGKLYLGTGQITNGSFDNNTEDWISDSFEPGLGSFQAGVELPTPHHDVKVHDDSTPRMGWAAITQMDDIFNPYVSSTFRWWSHGFCPAPGRHIKLRFRWRVATNHWGDSWMDNWWELWTDSDMDDGKPYLGFEQNWGTVSALLKTYPVGGAALVRATDWEQALVEFNVPAIPPSELVFGIGGYGPDSWITLIDDVCIDTDESNCITGELAEEK